MFFVNLKFHAVFETGFHSFCQSFWDSSVLQVFRENGSLHVSTVSVFSFRYLILAKNSSNFPFTLQDNSDSNSFSAIYIGNVDKLVINYINLIKDCTTERKHLSMKRHVHPHSQSILNFFVFDEISTFCSAFVFNHF